MIGLYKSCACKNHSQEPDVKIKGKYISVDAYGFCSADSGPQKYYFELNLFDDIDIEVQVKLITYANYPRYCCD